jgi:NADH-quinone oxidoreductase subunit A
MEIVFLFPWSLIAFNLGFFGFLVILVFLIILFLGFFYEWWVGALDWE